MPSPNTNHWETNPEYIDLLNYIIEETKHVESPMSIQQMAREFKEKSGAEQGKGCLRQRIYSLRSIFHTFGHIDTNTKVKVLFALSIPIDANFLKKLKKNAHVKVDDEKRIKHYKAKDGSLELKGDHSLSTKNSITQLASKRSHRSMIGNYFENKKNATAIPRNKEEKETWDLIECIAEKCQHVNSPLSIRQLTKDFNKKFGISVQLETSQYRIKSYCHEIQKAEFLDTQTKVKQLFGLGVKMDSDCLKELRKDAVVEVDDLNRITKYTANDGSLTLHGDHSQSAKIKLNWMERRKNKKPAKKISSSGGDENEYSEEEIHHSEEDSDEYSSEEFGSEFDSDEENDHLDEAEDLTQPSEGTDDSVNETPVRNRSLTNMSFDDNFDFDPPTERSHRSDETEMREEKESGPVITENASVKTRSGRLSKRRHLDSTFSNNQANTSSSGTSTSTDLASSKPEKQKKKTIEKDQASNSPNHTSSSSRWIRRSTRNSSIPSISTESEENMDNQKAPEAEGNPSDYHGSRIQEMEDYDYNPREDNHPESTPIDNPIEEPRPPTTEEHNSNIEAQNTDNRRMDDNISHEDSSRIELEPFREPLGIPNVIEEDSNIQQFPQPHPQVMETPIKKECVEEARTSLKMVLNAFKSLVLGLDTSALSHFQLELDKRIMEAGRRIEVPNKEVVLTMELLIVKLNRHGSPKYSEDSISLRDILLMLRMIILNSSFTGLEVILEMLKENIEQLKALDKKIPVSKVECVLRATLDNICA